MKVILIRRMQMLIDVNINDKTIANILDVNNESVMTMDSKI